jgi:hypothetical protein
LPENANTPNNLKILRFEVFTEVRMKNCVFWDITTCGFEEPTFRRNLAPPSSG